MTLETARRGIDFVAANAAQRRSPYFEVGYHGGGEPTVHWPVLTASFDYAREKAAELQLELRSSVATNGVLSGPQIDWIVAHVGGVSLSCDGLPNGSRRVPADRFREWLQRPGDSYAAAVRRGEIPLRHPADGDRGAHRHAGRLGRVPLLRVPSVLDSDRASLFVRAGREGGLGGVGRIH